MALSILSLLLPALTACIGFSLCYFVASLVRSALHLLDDSFLYNFFLFLSSQLFPSCFCWAMSRFPLVTLTKSLSPFLLSFCRLLLIFFFLPLLFFFFLEGNLVWYWHIIKDTTAMEGAVGSGICFSLTVS